MRIWTIAVFPACAGIDTWVLAMGKSFRSEAGRIEKERSVFRASVMDPWKFKMELRQQSGSEDEFGGVVLVSIGQHACCWG
jgi:hypothetical protein